MGRPPEEPLWLSGPRVPAVTAKLCPVTCLSSAFCPSAGKRKRERPVLEHHFPTARASHRWHRSAGASRLRSPLHSTLDKSGVGAGDIRLESCLCQSQQCDPGQGITSELSFLVCTVRLGYLPPRVGTRIDGSVYSSAQLPWDTSGLLGVPWGRGAEDEWRLSRGVFPRNLT